MSPALRIAAACEKYGSETVVGACVALLGGGDADPGLVVALGGPHAESVLGQGVPEVHRYWLRTWGARGLLYAWDETAAEEVVRALVAGCADEAWRVREMVCKVLARRAALLPAGAAADAFDAALGLRDDPVPRVWTAADRAVTRLAAAGD